MPRFFINRPIFASVIAILVTLAGILSITSLPVSQYPAIAPPQIAIRRHLSWRLRRNRAKYRHPGN